MIKKLINRIILTINKWSYAYLNKGDKVTTNNKYEFKYIDVPEDKVLMVENFWDGDDYDREAGYGILKKYSGNHRETSFNLIILTILQGVYKDLELKGDTKYLEREIAAYIERNPEVMRVATDIIIDDVLVVTGAKSYLRLDYDKGYYKRDVLTSLLTFAENNYRAGGGEYRLVNWTGLKELLNDKI